MKILIPQSRLGPDTFADFYRFPQERGTPAPLVVWIGGAISSETYERRMRSEPEELLNALGDARERLACPPCDALILSSPATSTPSISQESFWEMLPKEFDRFKGA